MVAIVLLNLRHEPHHQQHKVTECCLARLGNACIHIYPVVVELIFLNFESLQHRTVDKTCKDLAHGFDTTLEEGLLDYFWVDKLVQEPLSELGFVVHVRLEVFDHASDMDFEVCSLHHCNVVSCSKLKHSEFSSFNLLLGVQFVEGQ